MRMLTAGALCALLAAAPVLAQTDSAPAQSADVYRNDLPETHEGLGLPPLGKAQDSEALPQELESISRMATAGQQMGNLAASKSTSGVVRDLGDAMALVQAAVNSRFAGLEATGDGAGLPRDLDAQSQKTLTQLGNMTGPAFGKAFASWVTDTYPELIDDWAALEDSPRFGELSKAVQPWLKRQLRVAQAVNEAGGASGQMELSALPPLVPGQVKMKKSEGSADTQLDERQHTQETEAPAYQTGENYAHEQIKTDPQSETRMSGEGTTPAGEPGVPNSASVFMALANLRTELSQLESRGDVSSDDVRVVPAQETMAAADLEAVRSSVKERQADVEALRQAIEGREAFAGALDGADSSSSDVIALDVTDQGAVLYTLREGG